MEVSDFKLEVGLRLKQFILNLRIEQKEFAQSIGYSDSAFSSIIKGKSGLSSDFVWIMINQYPNLNWHWLLTGKGEMGIKDNNIVMGDNNGTMHVQSIPNAEILLERLKALEKEVEGLKEQIKLKDQIIELLKGKT